MVISDVITLAAVVVALAVGVGSLLQTLCIQKKQYKERLLNEIIEWAKISAESAIHRRKTDNDELWKAKSNYKYCLAQTPYITVVADSAFPEITSFVKLVDGALKNTKKCTNDLLENYLEENHQKMKNSENELTDAVVKLLEESARIRLRIE